MHDRTTRSSHTIPRAALGATLTICICAAASIAAQPAPHREGKVGSTDRDQWRSFQRGDVGAKHDKPATPPPPPPMMFRTYDGGGNNPQFPDWGRAGSDYLRDQSGAHYADGIAAPSGADRPSARIISNTIADQSGLFIIDERGLSTAIYEFGQFLDHDIGLALGGSTEEFDIAVPAGDPYFDPTSTGTRLIFLDRSGFNAATGSTTPRQQVNTITAFVDASQVYGSDATRAAWLRTFNGGRLRVDASSGVDYLPFNDGTLANDNPAGLPATALRVGGDVRANEQPGLTVLHTVFLREHNRQADRIAQDHPEWDDERIYQEARRIVGAMMQAITYEEFLPALLGHPLPPYQGYRPEVNPGLSNVFATAAYRFGHSQVGPDIDVINENFEDIGVLELADVFFNPLAIPSVGGIDPLIRYFAIAGAQRVDTMVVDPLRNFLFGPPGAGGFDLVSLNIQRGRDHGLPDYNTVRADHGLPRVQSFAQITSNPALATKLAALYGDVDSIDAWVGMVAEDHIPGGSVGRTADAVITDQFRRLRDGDRFWYENAGLDPQQVDTIRRTRLADLLQRNSGVIGLQREVFFAQNLAAPSGCIADINGDGVVNTLDFTVIAAHFGQPVAPGTNGDLNSDGIVNGADFGIFAANYGCE